MAPFFRYDEWARTQTTVSPAAIMQSPNFYNFIFTHHRTGVKTSRHHQRIQKSFAMHSGGNSAEQQPGQCRRPDRLLKENKSRHWSTAPCYYAPFTVGVFLKRVSGLLHPFELPEHVDLLWKKAQGS